MDANFIAFQDIFEGYFITLSLELKHFRFDEKIKPAEGGFGRTGKKREMAG